MKRLSGIKVADIAEDALHDANPKHAVQQLQVIAQHNSDQFTTVAPFKFALTQKNPTKKDVTKLVSWIFNQMTNNSFRVIDPMMKQINQQDKLSLVFVEKIIRRAKAIKNASHGLLLLAQVVAHNTNWFSKDIQLQIQNELQKNAVALINVRLLATSMQKQLKNQFKPKHVLHELNISIAPNMYDSRLLDNIYGLETADVKDSKSNLGAYMPFTLQDGTIPYEPDESVDLNSDYLSLALGLLEKYQIDISHYATAQKNLMLASHYIMHMTGASASNVTYDQPIHNYKYALKAKKELDQPKA